MIAANPKFRELIHVCRNLRELSREEMYMTSEIEEPDLLAEQMVGDRLQWVAYHDGKPAAVIGARQAHPGVWNLYGFGTDDYEHIMLEVTKHARRVMMPEVKATGAHRAQALSPADHVETHKWLRFLGAKEEARLGGFGKNGEDVLVFAWRREKSCA